MLKILVTVVSMLFAFVAAGQLTVDVMPRHAVVDPQTNTASAVVHLGNGANEALEVLLMADDFVADGKVEGLGAKTLFAVGDATPVKSELLVTIPPKGMQSVWMVVTNVGHAGIARSRLMNHTTKIADLVVVRTQFPFNVAPLGWKDSAPFAIRIESGGGPLLFLKNEDPFDYFVTWSLNAPGLKLKEDPKPVFVPAQSTQMVQIPVDGWLPSKGDVNALLKNLSSPGSLRLAATDASGVGKPWKTRVFRSRSSGPTGRPPNKPSEHFVQRQPELWGGVN
jgi:hypothetical protein